MTQGRWLLFLIACLASLAAGWFLALRFGAESGAGRAATLPPSSGPASAPASALAVLTVDDLRRVVREELAQAGGHRVAAQANLAQPPVAQPELTPAQAAAQQRASQLLDDAISRRQWTNEDVDAMQGVFHQLNPEQQAEVMRQYAVAVNQGRLIPQTDRIPF